MNRLLLIFLIALGAHSLSAQDFDKTLGKVPLEQRKTSQFKLFKTLDFSDSAYSKNYYGFKMGMNLSHFVGDVCGTNNLVGLRVGGLYGRYLNNRTALQIELAYSKQGAQQNSDSLQTGILLDSGTAISSRHNFIALPITLKYYPSENVSFFLEGGVRFAYLIRGELQGTRGGQFTNTSKDKIDISDRLNKLDAGLVLGAGYSFSRNLDFSVRYNYNFTEYLDTSNSKTVNSGSFRNNLLQFSLGFYFE